KTIQSDPVEIKIGVKQGDPMSPFLFNFAMDPLLRKLEEGGSGYQHCLERITCMVFTEDLLLLSGSCEGMQMNIKILEACD
ncbi:PO21 protein, partial [Sagittarius serpentarius]|nr:PO21 protein [Sagittarius serpentarius]